MKDQTILKRPLQMAELMGIFVLKLAFPGININQFFAKNTIRLNFTSKEVDNVNTF